MLDDVDLPARLATKNDRGHDGVAVEFLSYGLPAATASGELGAALIGLGPYHQIPQALNSLPVAHQPLVVAVSREHRLAARSSVRLSALRNEPLVTLTPGSGLRTTIEAACRAAGFTPRIAAETSDLTLLVDLAAEQVGVAILPHSAPQATASRDSNSSQQSYDAASHSPGLRQRPRPQPEYSWTSHSGSSPAISAHRNRLPQRTRSQSATKQ